MIRPTIFLDLDGVIAPFKKPIDTKMSKQEWTPDKMKERGLSVQADPDCLARLKRIIKATNAKVVIISSWRIGSVGYWLGLKYELIDGFGINSVCDRTDYLPNLNRSDEVKAWLTAHPRHKNFIIIDDSGDFGELENRRIHPEHSVGITDIDVELAISLLNENK